MEPGAPADLSALYLGAACGLGRTSEDGTFLVVNDTLCRWLGRTRADLVGRATLQGLLTMGGRIFHQTHWAPLLRMQGSVSEVKLDLVHADGGTMPVVLNALRHETAQGVVHEIALFVARDRDLYEKELVASRRKLQELVAETTRLHELSRDRAVFAEQMVGIVSHDLRNPLSTIHMSATLLARPGVDPAPVLGRLTRAADRATRLIGDLLDFTQARLGSGIAVTPARMDLCKCVAEAVDDFATIHAARAITHRHLGERHCVGDCDRLAQLVGNLIANAVAYGDPARPVEVLSRVDEGVAAISVRNWGAPIPPELQATLFQPMVRGEVEAGGRSVGLGLYIVGEIAKSHGGTVRVESSAEGGTCFSVSFGAAP
jgi:phosphoserine phosphatase RsbU/P